MSWCTTSDEFCSACGKITPHMNGYCQEQSHDIDDTPLITAKHYNRASTALGKIYRVSTNPPDKYPEIGCVDVTTAHKLLANAMAEIDFLQNKLKKYENV